MMNAGATSSSPFFAAGWSYRTRRFLDYVGGGEYLGKNEHRFVGYNDNDENVDGNTNNKHGIFASMDMDFPSKNEGIVPHYVLKKNEFL